MSEYPYAVAAFIEQGLVLLDDDRLCPILGSTCDETEHGHTVTCKVNDGLILTVCLHCLGRPVFH